MRLLPRSPRSRSPQAREGAPSPARGGRDGGRAGEGRGGGRRARLILIFGLLLLGAAAFVRLPMDYLPQQSFPELTVQLTLSEEGSEPGEVTRAWVEEIEGAVRSLGRVQGTRGEVSTNGAVLTVRFAPGTDPERKAARLESELAGLRDRLPDGSRLDIAPASQAEGQRLALVWLEGVRQDADAERAAEALRAIPGVGLVETLGLRQEELRVELAAGTLDPWGTAAAVRREVEGSLRTVRLGSFRQGDRRLPVVAPPISPSELARLPIPIRTGGAVPLGAVAAVRPHWREPWLRVRYNGAPARALFVYRAHGAPLLPTDRALRERVAALPGGLRGTVDWSEAEPLRTLLGRLALGALLAIAMAAAAGGFLAGRPGALALGLALPAGLAAAANALWLAGISLHITTLVALAIGVSGALPAAAFRILRPGKGFGVLAATAIASAAAVPIAVALAGTELGPLLGEPSRALLLSLAAALAAAALLPAASGEGARRLPDRLAASQRRTLRDPGTVLLAVVTAGAIAVTLFAGALVPQPGDLTPDGGNLTIRLRLPEGSTLAEAEQQIRPIEEELARTEEVVSYLSSARAGQAFLSAEVRPEDRRPDRMAKLATRLRYRIPGAGAAQIDTGLQAATGRPLDFEMEDRAETDEEARLYKVVLRSADLDALRAAYDRILNRLDHLKVRRFWIHGWGDPSIRLSLRPLGGTLPNGVGEIAARLGAASRPPVVVPLPRNAATGAERSLVVVAAGPPVGPARAIPSAAEILGRPLRLGERAVTPAATLGLREEVLHPQIGRQSGRFVLPIEIRPRLNSEEKRRELIKNADRNLAQLPLPVGVDLERPSLTPQLWQRDRLRILGLALAVPLLLFAVGTCRLGSPLKSLVALVPLAVGLLAAAPLVRASLGQVDELTVFALAAALALALPAVAELAMAGAPATGAADPPAGLYRALRRESAWLFAALAPLVLALAVPTIGADLIRFRWVVPLRAAALAGGASLFAAAFVVAPLRAGLARWRTRDPEEVRRQQHPPVWSEPGPPALEVRSLTKIYRSGVPALSAVSFTLEPGIIGLLGPNGAGKTTLLRLLTGLLQPTRGHVIYRGVPVAADNLAEYRRRIGFLPQEFNAYPDFTAEQFLDHWALERGMDNTRLRREEIERLLAAVGLSEHARRKVRDFSGGMRQRVGIARALLGTPPILIVDEPTTGLDIESRSRFRQILLEQAGERIVLFSTHIASDVEAAARRLLLLHRGRLRFDGTPEDLAARARGRVFEALVADADLAAFGHRYRITARVRRLEGIQVRAIARPGEPLAGDPVEPNLEEAYLAEIDVA